MKDGNIYAIVYHGLVYHVIQKPVPPKLQLSIVALT